MQDTGFMRQNALTYTEVSPMDLMMGANKVEYAGKQQAMRKFVFFDAPEDVIEICTFAARYLLTGRATA
jgi:hypothetical protein